MSAVCWQCIEDDHLKKLIRARGKVAKCSLCEKIRKAFTAEDLAEVLDPIMREHFVPGEEVMRFGEDDAEWWEQDGDPLSFHLQEVIGTYLGFEDEIVDALEANDGARPQDGEESFYDSSQDYVSIPTRPYSYHEEWSCAEEDLKHRRRFFSSAASSLFNRLFEGVEIRTSRNQETRAAESVAWDLPEGSLLFRARICDSRQVLEQAYKEPLKHVGPPPSEYARAGRMNVDGVVVFYGALDCETCLAETRPVIGNETAVIQLRTTKPLRLLDFRRLDDSYDRLSYFQPDFTEQVEKGVFLRSLQNLISQPVVPGREMDYLITQTMAEYLAHVYRPPFDGILFKSVQRSGGTNIVLFPNGSDEFPLAYVENSFELFSTRSVEYEHWKKYVGMHDGIICVGYDDEDD